MHTYKKDRRRTKECNAVGRGPHITNLQINQIGFTIAVGQLSGKPSKLSGQFFAVELVICNLSAERIGVHIVRIVDSLQQISTILYWNFLKIKNEELGQPIWQNNTRMERFKKGMPLQSVGPLLCC